MAAQEFRKAKAYILAYELAMEIFEITKTFPKEERYSLTDQIRRSSRSVCANIGEAYRKRLYPDTLFLNQQMLMPKTPRLVSGWIFVILANT